MEQYQKYKPSRIDWISEIPIEWEAKRLKYHIDFFTGFAFKSEMFSIDQGIKLVRGINVKESVLNWGDTRFWNDSTDSLQDFFLRENDVLIAMDGSKVGKNYCIIKEEDLPLLLVQRVARLRANYLLIPKFLFYQIGCIYFLKWVDVSKTDPAVPHISPADIRNYPICLPPIEQQTHIVNFLDQKTIQISKLISNKRKLIELLKEERTAIINEAVSGKGKNWERKKLKYVAKLRDELIDNSEFKIAVENIESSSGRLVNMQEEKNYEGQLSAFFKGDTIFNKLRPYLHKVYLAEKDGGLYGELLIIYSIGELTPEFLFFKLFSKNFIDVVDGSTQGTKMPRANWNDFISQLLISFPKDKIEQTAIVQHIQTEIQQVDRTISKIEQEIELMNEYRTALISEVVTGKIKVAE